MNSRLKIMKSHYELQHRGDKCIHILSFHLAVVPCVAKGDPLASVELFCEDHVAVLGDSQWVWCEGSSRCGLRLDLIALVVGCCIAGIVVECGVLGYKLCGVQALLAEEGGIWVRIWGFSKGCGWGPSCLLGWSGLNINDKTWQFLLSAQRTSKRK